MAHEIYADALTLSPIEAENDPAAIEEAMIEDKKLHSGVGGALHVRQKNTKAVEDEEIQTSWSRSVTRLPKVSTRRIAR